MYSIARLPEDERRILFRNTAQKMGMNEAIIEKDFWVCLTLDYIVLRASKEETMKRAVERSKLDRKTNVELVETMWEQFCNLGIYESNVIETTTYSIQEAVFAVKEKISSGAALLS